MSKQVPSNGIARVNLAALDRIAAVSRAPFTIKQLVGVPNTPNAWFTLQDVAAYVEYRSAAFAAGAVLSIEAGEDDVLYAEGVSAVITELIGQRAQGASTAMTTDADITPAGLLSCLIIGTHAVGATQTYTLPTGALLDAAVEMAVGESIDWNLINASAAAADTITLANAATGHTIVGNVVVVSDNGAPANTAMFRTRKTAVDTFVTYRID